MPSQPLPQPLDPLWKPGTIVWILMVGEAIALALSLAPGLDGDRLILFGLNSLVIQWVALLTLGSLYLLRAVLSSRSPQMIAVATLCLLLSATWVTFTLLWSLLRSLIPPPEDGWGGLLFHMSCMALIIGLLAMAAFQNHWRSRQLAIQAKQAEFDALQARVRPHFLFNALNSAISLVRDRPQEAERLLMDLADLFRAALGSGRSIPLAQELELSRHYLDIEQARFDTRLTVRWEVVGEPPQLSVPALTLQPLLENAIRHGVEPSPSGGSIDIAVRYDPGTAIITVRNSLPAQCGNGGHGIGLDAIRARLARLPDASLTTRISDSAYVAELVLREVRQVTTR